MLIGNGDDEKTSAGSQTRLEMAGRGSPVGSHQDLRRYKREGLFGGGWAWRGSASPPAISKLCIPVCTLSLMSGTPVGCQRFLMVGPVSAESLSSSFLLSWLAGGADCFWGAGGAAGRVSSTAS